MTQTLLSVPPVLTYKPLESLYEMVGVESVADIIQCYMTESTKYLRRIETAIAEQDTIGLELAASVLKGSSAFLGATVLADLCRDLEAIARTQILHPATEKLPLLESEYERVHQALQFHLKFVVSLIPGRTPALCAEAG